MAEPTFASRRDRIDLLSRPPCQAPPFASHWADLLVDPVDQLIALGDLLARGSLSPDEYERQKAKVLGS